MDQNFWESRWEQKLTGWDIGHDSPPLINYMLQVPDKSVKILIPGCGNAHETEILLNLGFKDIHLMAFVLFLIFLMTKRSSSNSDDV